MKKIFLALISIALTCFLVLVEGANLAPTSISAKEAAVSDVHMCTQAIVTGLTSSPEGNMAGQNIDPLRGVNLATELYMQLVVPPDGGYRYLVVKGDHPPMDCVLLNEKGVGIVGGGRFPPPTLPESPDPSKQVFGSLMKESNSAKEFVEKWGGNLTKYGGAMGGGGKFIIDPNEGYLVEYANWVYDNPENHHIFGPMTDQIFVASNFYISEKLAPYQAGIGLGYNRSKRLWQLLVDRQFESPTEGPGMGITLPYFMNCFRDHGNVSPEQQQKTSNYASEGDGSLSVCIHGLTALSGHGVVLLSNKKSTDLISCMWWTFTQPCISPFLPFYIGINELPTDVTTGNCAKVFERLRIAVDLHPDYRDRITEYWTRFDLNTIEEANSLQFQVAMTASDAVRINDARAILTDFVGRKVTQAMSAATQLIDQLNNLPIIPGPTQ